jgi:hypothetical protein
MDDDVSEMLALIIVAMTLWAESPGLRRSGDGVQSGASR